MFASMKSWLATRRPRPLDELLAVECEDDVVRVRALDHADPSWNQECRWADITRVCFRDGGPWQTDIVHLEVRDRPEALDVPTEARGGGQFMNELAVRGLLPQPAFGEAIRSTDGSLHCWPPDDPEGAERG
jgi:hypothetical protein